MSPEKWSARKALSESGLNASYQRMRILENLMARMDHPTAGMVYDALLKEMPSLARATVYNTLNALAEKGLVTALTITPEEVRYDCTREPHHHFLCKHCGSILDIAIRCRYAGTGELLGHRVEDIHGYFKGTCRDCLRSKRGPRPRSNGAPKKKTTRKGG